MMPCRLSHYKYDTGTGNWEEPEYASAGKKARLEEKFLQKAIIFRMIATQA